MLRIDDARTTLPFSRPRSGGSPIDHELTVVIPAYNEEDRLPQTLDGLEEYLNAWGVDYRVLVVDDGSRDRTSELVADWGRNFSVFRQANGGKGSAVRHGMLKATGRVIAFTDADLPYHLDSMRAGYDQIYDHSVEVVFGARDLQKSANVASRRLMRRIAHEVFRNLMRLLVSRQVGDTQCGLKLFSRRAAREIFSRCEINGFAFDAEVVYLTHALGLSFSRVPVTLINEYATTISLARHAVPMLGDVLALRWRSLTGQLHLDSPLLPEETMVVESPVVDMLAERRRTAA
ncbi:MAG: glycosyltransferase [Planctomycetaceae bacterium]|jgi:dolichyl-phosphate beta-glucosyltransferase